MFTPKILSRHPSHSVLRGQLPQNKVRSVVRFGSTTTIQQKFPKLKEWQKVIEINSVEGIKNSASKLLMKQKFTEVGVKTCDWWTYYGSPNGGNLFLINGKPTENNTGIQAKDLPYPIIAKSFFGSRGEGNYKLDTQEALEQWMKNKDLSNYLFEEFKSYNLEYRLHIAKNIGCFYTCRKMLKNETPKEERWRRHEDTSVWILENNPLFSKPNTWNDIVNDCMKALDSLGLDVCSFDVKVQSKKTKEGKQRDYQDYFLLESNSASSFGDVTGEKYKEILPILIKNKIETL